MWGTAEASAASAAAPASLAASIPGCVGVNNVSVVGGEVQ